jgi:hypothetical protein
VRVAGGPTGDVVADREEGGAGECQHCTERAEVLRPRPLADQHGAAGDHEHGSEDEQRLEGLAEKREGDRNRHQRSRSDQDRDA